MDKFIINLTFYSSLNDLIYFEMNFYFISEEYKNKLFDINKIFKF